MHGFRHKGGNGRSCDINGITSVAFSGKVQIRCISLNTDSHYNFTNDVSLTSDGWQRSGVRDDHASGVLLLSSGLIGIDDGFESIGSWEFFFLIIITPIDAYIEQLPDEAVPVDCTIPTCDIIDDSLTAVIQAERIRASNVSIGIGGFLTGLAAVRSLDFVTESKYRSIR